MFTRCVDQSSEELSVWKVEMCRGEEKLSCYDEALRWMDGGVRKRWGLLLASLL